MTTKITVDAHAGWPVQVTQRPIENREERNAVTVVPPNTTQDFHVWDGIELIIRELNRPSERA